MARLGCALAAKSVLALILLSCAIAFASDLSGKVINRTTGKPAVGDDVVLFSDAQSSTEVMRAKTDHTGRFHIPVDDSQPLHLLHIIHQGVTYQRTIPAGAKAVPVQVYDVAKKLKGVSVIMDVESFQATSSTLQVEQIITVRNASQPPRTLLSEHPFEIELPSDAVIKSGLVLEEGQPLKQQPVPAAQPGSYYFFSPLRPGNTRFAVVYDVPYDGQAFIRPKLRNPNEQFVVVLPNSMTFQPSTAGLFRTVPNTSPDRVEQTAPVSDGQRLSFRISGTGKLAAVQLGQPLLLGHSARLSSPFDGSNRRREYYMVLLGVIALVLLVGVVIRTLTGRAVKHQSVAQNG